eukprot:5342741-Pleurochrysis_carterae.AAC.2
MLALRGSPDAPKQIWRLRCTRRAAGTAGSPIKSSLSHTGGGPPSAASLQRKKREAENVEHGARLPRRHNNPLRIAATGARIRN